MEFKPTLWKVIVSILLSAAYLIFNFHKITYSFQFLPEPIYYSTMIYATIQSFIFIFILSYIIFSLFQNTKFSLNKTELICSIAASLILFVVGMFKLLDNFKSQSYISKYASITSYYFLRELLSPFMIISLVILFFVIYYSWISLEKNEFFKLNYRKIIAFLIIMSPVIISDYFNSGFLLNFFYPLLLFCDLESCNVAESFYVLIFSHFILAFLSYSIVCLIIKKVDLLKKIKIKARH